MFLPYASESIVEIAQSAIDGASFKSDVTDQFLTMCAMDWMSDYDGDGDFGTLTRIDIDDEDRVVLSLLDLIGHADATGGIVTDWNVECIISHYRENDAMLGESSDRKWWADWYPCKSDAADKAQAEFSDRYSEYLGDED